MIFFKLNYQKQVFTSLPGFSEFSKTLFCFVTFTIRFILVQTWIWKKKKRKKVASNKYNHLKLLQHQHKHENIIITKLNQVKSNQIKSNQIGEINVKGKRQKA